MPESILYCYVLRVEQGETQLLTRTSFVETRYDVPNDAIKTGEIPVHTAQRIVLEQVGIEVDTHHISVLDADESDTATYCRVDVAGDYPERFSHTDPGAQDIAEFHYRWLSVDATLPSMLVESATGALGNLIMPVNASIASRSVSKPSLKQRVADLFIGFWSNWPIPEWLRTLVIWTVVPKYLAGVVGLIFDEQDRVLLVKHTYRKDFPWAPPSGWMKRGEDPTQALEREIFEETGYRVWVGGSIAVGGDKHMRRLDLYFRCALLGGEFRPCAEVSDAKWCALDELPDTIEPFHGEVIAYAAKRKGAGVPPRAE